MRNQIFIKTVFIIFLFLSVTSCKKNSDTEPTVIAPTYEEIKDLISVQGTSNSNIIVINTQGGPTNSLQDSYISQFMLETGTGDALWVNVHQVQTKNPELFNLAISFDQAKAYDITSVANLKKVIDYYKSLPNKKVYVLGISFGAFMTQELIATYGIDVADKYMIMVGRLDIDELTWKPFSEGKYTMYLYDTNGQYTIFDAPSDPSMDPIVGANMAKLAAGLGYNRYSTKLASIASLAKVTYVYGDRDEQVGVLSAAEIKFLSDKGATVVLEVNGMHDTAIAKGTSLFKAFIGL